MKIAIKRVYEKASADDGQRILVDRLWPRGLTKAEAHLDAWVKEAAPTSELRKWFGHEPEKWRGFREKYRHELTHRPESKEALAELRKLSAEGKVTLLYGAHDEEHNQAVVLQEALLKK